MLLVAGRNGGKAQKELANAAAAAASATPTAKTETDKDACASTSAATSATASPTNANLSPSSVTTPISTSNPNASASQNALTDPNHWSKQEKFDADAFLECAYKKHLSRHANKWVVWNRKLFCPNYYGIFPLMSFLSHSFSLFLLLHKRIFLCELFYTPTLFSIHILILLFDFLLFIVLLFCLLYCIALPIFSEYFCACVCSITFNMRLLAT